MPFQQLFRSLPGFLPVKPDIEGIHQLQARMILHFNTETVAAHFADIALSAVQNCIAANATS